MNSIIIDTECNGALRNNAHPFDSRNSMIALGCNDFHSTKTFYWDKPITDEVKQWITSHDTFIGFNIKFDLHWLRRYCIDLRGKRVWDCQLAEFILRNQRGSYPSLDECLVKYGLPTKEDTLQKYLSQNIDVCGIPKEELLSYLRRDLESTGSLYRLQTELIKPYKRLFDLQCRDLVVLADMEWNGIKYDLNVSTRLAEEYAKKEQEIFKKLNDLVNVDFINWNSGDHLSAILYGGKIDVEERVQVGVYMTGKKQGLPRYKITHRSIPFPRLVEPLKGSELKKGGYWSTAQEKLSELKASGTGLKIIKLISEQSKLSKERSTYFEGIPKTMEHFNWNNGILHGQINQCVAVTGRTSASNPNQQNVSAEGKECFVSRFEDENT